jgi:hypothetical protein
MGADRARRFLADTETRMVTAPVSPAAIAAKITPMTTHRAMN